MTTLFLSEKKCYVCGSNNRYPLIDLTLKITGSRDLDGRPSHIQRSLVYLWIQHCTLCNYCGPEISKGDPGDIEIVKSEEYLSLLNDPKFPETASAFICHSFIMEKKGKYSDSGWAQLCAAWICDDNNYQGSIECRMNAYRLFTKTIESGSEFGDSRIKETIYLIDILRRTLQFDKALELCMREIANEQPDHILDLLEFEISLIQKKDAACHNKNESEEFY